MQLIPLLQPFRHALNDVQIGRKGFGFGDDDFALWGLFHLNAQRRCQNLEQVRTGGVGDNDLVVFPAHQLGNFVTNAHGQIPPMVFVPTVNQISAPLTGHHIGGSLQSHFRASPQRITIQINRVFGQGKLLL